MILRRDGQRFDSGAARDDMKLPFESGCTSHGEKNPGQFLDRGLFLCAVARCVEMRGAEARRVAMRGAARRRELSYTRSSTAAYWIDDDQNSEHDAATTARELHRSAGHRTALERSRALPAMPALRRLCRHARSDLARRSPRSVAAPRACDGAQ
jgi:hypothetical protein